ncbi:hypothetical protein HDU96_002084 [Phlyctochytrium bullatum]|nr:hypothetical protein HDU96_002084 [Phlyctochytrium bullatum]
MPVAAVDASAALSGDGHSDDVAHAKDRKALLIAKRASWSASTSSRSPSSSLQRSSSTTSKPKHQHQAPASTAPVAPPRSSSITLRNRQSFTSAYAALNDILIKTPASCSETASTSTIKTLQRTRSLNNHAATSTALVRPARPTRAATIASLPAETLARIFSFLLVDGGVPSLIAVERTCRVWRCVVLREFPSSLWPRLARLMLSSSSSSSSSPPSFFPFSSSDLRRDTSTCCCVGKTERTPDAPTAHGHARCMPLVALHFRRACLRAFAEKVSNGDAQHHLTIDTPTLLAVAPASREIVTIARASPTTLWTCVETAGVRLYGSIPSIDSSTTAFSNDHAWICWKPLADPNDDDADPLPPPAIISPTTACPLIVRHDTRGLLEFYEPDQASPAFARLQPDPTSLSRLPDPTPLLTHRWEAPWQPTDMDLVAVHGTHVVIVGGWEDAHITCLSLSHETKTLEPRWQTPHVQPSRAKGWRATHVALSDTTLAVLFANPSHHTQRARATHRLHIHALRTGRLAAVVLLRLPSTAAVTTVAADIATASIHFDDGETWRYDVSGAVARANAAPAGPVRIRDPMQRTRGPPASAAAVPLDDEPGWLLADVGATGCVARVVPHAAAQPAAEAHTSFRPRRRGPLPMGYWIASAEPVVETPQSPPPPTPPVSTQTSLFFLALLLVAVACVVPARAVPLAWIVTALLWCTGATCGAGECNGACAAPKLETRVVWAEVKLDGFLELVQRAAEGVQVTAPAA